MSNMRLLIEKGGRSVYLSHLDLIHTLERAFNRAQIRIRHTQGYNPHPYLSFCMPLSLGVSSACEILDFGLENEADAAALPERLNAALPEGIRVLSVYESPRKTRELTWLALSGTLLYDSPHPEAAEGLTQLFRRTELVILRKTKRGEGPFDLIPWVREIAFTQKDGKTVTVEAVVHAQEPGVGPNHLVAAAAQLCPELAPDFSRFCRREVYDAQMHVFR